MQNSAEKGILRDVAYYCDHLGSSERDEIDFAHFSVRHPEHSIGLERYARYVAFSDEDANLMRTYTIRDNDSDELVGYFSLKAGLVSINERINTETGEQIFDTIPGIEIANFALSNSYLHKYPEAKGVGNLIFRHFIKPIVREISVLAGARLLYIFALPKESLIARYHDVYEFRRLDAKSEHDLHSRVKPVYDVSCIFMYQLI